MAEDMVERVALALWASDCAELGDPPSLISKDLDYIMEAQGNAARAAIATMREPTEVVIEAGWEEMGRGPRQVFNAMIDAALGDDDG